jgi:hypothetical protein
MSSSDSDDINWNQFLKPKTAKINVGSSHQAIIPPMASQKQAAASSGLQEEAFEGEWKEKYLLAPQQNSSTRVGSQF